MAAGPRQSTDGSLLRRRRRVRATPSPCIFVKLEPARDYGVSSFGPGFGALVGTDRTAMLARTCPRRPGGYDLDSARDRRARSSSRRQAHVGSAARAVSRLPRRGAGDGARCAATIVPGTVRRQHGLSRSSRRQHGVPRRATCPVRCCRSATATTRWATARSWARPIEGAMNVELFVELVEAHRRRRCRASRTRTR